MTPRKDPLANPASQHQSPLMALPAELRNSIYKMFFSQDTVTIQEDSTLSTGFVQNQPLLITCKQLHKEAIGMYYATSVFELAGYRSNWGQTSSSGLLRWLRTIGSHRATLISCIHVPHECATTRRVFGAPAHPANQMFAEFEMAMRALRGVKAIVAEAKVFELDANVFRSDVYAPGGRRLWDTIYPQFQVHRAILPPTTKVWTSNPEDIFRTWIAAWRLIAGNCCVRCKHGAMLLEGKFEEGEKGGWFRTWT